MDKDTATELKTLPLPATQYSRDKRSPVPKNELVSHTMSRIKGKGTKPELWLRKQLWASGVRGYRVNYKDLPGKPDIVFTKYKLAVFINGCYWHGCETCGWKPPKHNVDYWVNKITRNRQRDVTNQLALESMGYAVLTLWEHDLKKGAVNSVVRIQEYLKPTAER